MCAWREPGKGLVGMGIFGGCSGTCFVKDKYKELPEETPCAKCVQLVAEESRFIFRTGCKICSVSQIAVQRVTQPSAECSLLHSAEHLFLPSS